ncbi:MAG: ATP-dependent DNA helicase RecG [Bifidobacteriaceae bacterium]|jgi:ATP-dependent DNA helicase RecG|nr:ATP-dependent DNA helicase RecG [Bifidobacteriaceae bacterium]
MQVSAGTGVDAYLAAPVERVVGRGGKKLAGAGIKTVGDLLRHYPKRYEDPRVPTDMTGLRLDEVVSINAQVASLAVRDIKRGTQWLVAVQITDGAHRLGLTFFLKKWHLVEFYSRQYEVGRMGLFTGRVSLYRGRQQLVHPEVVWADELRDQDPRFNDRLLPIYPAVAGIQSPQLQNAIRTSLKALGADPPTDPLPPRLLADRDLPGLGQAFWDIHNPAGASAWRAARGRFRFEEAFVLQTGLARRRHRLEAGAAARPRPARPPAPGAPAGLVERLDAALPFELTAAQRQAGRKLGELLALDRPMNQLLQGDVGSGKTLVALRAMLQVVDAAGQAALLAPTEVLATQHFRTIEGLLARLPEGSDQVTVRLLTGATPVKARASLLNQLEHGEVRIVVGTHALLEDSVKFHDLGLIVVDEQHRFGVEQRDQLRTRGADRPHLLVMTATPIPRTVAMTVFGDLGVTTLGDGPPGRPEVATTWVNPKEHPGWLDRVWQRLAEEVAAGHRGFVVCPAIEPGEFEAGADLLQDAGPRQGQLAFALPGGLRLDSAAGSQTGAVAEADAARAGGRSGRGSGAAGRLGPAAAVADGVGAVVGTVAGTAAGVSRASGANGKTGASGATRAPAGRGGAESTAEKRPLASVSQTLAALAADPDLAGVKLAPLHGRMTSQEKDQTMAAFMRGDVDVLVATTVIEVGIDVPQATALVVLDADRFGLSQLHQLRGRIGRGQAPGVCLLVSPAEPDSLAARRLAAMEQTRDGFELAEVDLETRREGEILGDSQSGRSSLKLVRLTSDRALIEDARNSAEALIAEDPELAGHPALAQAVDALLAGREDYLERG